MMARAPPLPVEKKKKRKELNPQIMLLSAEAGTLSHLHLFRHFLFEYEVFSRYRMHASQTKTVAIVFV